MNIPPEAGTTCETRAERERRAASNLDSAHAALDALELIRTATGISLAHTLRTGAFGDITFHLDVGQLAELGKACAPARPPRVTRPAPAYRRAHA